MANKIVIFSFSPIAKQIAKVLSKKDYSIIVIEENTELITQAKEQGYSVKNLSLMKDENIILAGLDSKEVKAFFCVSEDKHINLFVTLSVRNINKDIKIISTSFNSEDKKTILLAGANKVINPYEVGALRIFRFLHKPLILDVMDNILFSDSNIQIAEFTIKENTIYDGLYLKDIKLSHENDIIILGIQDKEISEDFIFYSTGINHIINHGDTLVLLGYKEQLNSFKKLINSYKKQK